MQLISFYRSWRKMQTLCCALKYFRSYTHTLMWIKHKSILVFETSSGSCGLCHTSHQQQAKRFSESGNVAPGLYQDLVASEISTQFLCTPSWRGTPDQINLSLQDSQIRHRVARINSSETWQFLKNWARRCTILLAAPFQTVAFLTASALQRCPEISNLRFQTLSLRSKVHLYGANSECITKKKKRGGLGIIITEAVKQLSCRENTGKTANSPGFTVSMWHFGYKWTNTGRPSGEKFNLSEQYPL